MNLRGAKGGVCGKTSCRETRLRKSMIAPVAFCFFVFCRLCTFGMSSETTSITTSRGSLEAAHKLKVPQKRRIERTLAAMKSPSP